MFWTMTMRNQILLINLPSVSHNFPLQVWEHDIFRRDIITMREIFGDFKQTQLYYHEFLTWCCVGLPLTSKVSIIQTKQRDVFYNYPSSFVSELRSSSAYQPSSSCTHQIELNWIEMRKNSETLQRQFCFS